MKKKFSLSLILGLAMSLSLTNTSCSDDDPEIVRSYPLNGNWRFNGMKYQVDANLDPVKQLIIADIQSKNLTSEYILNLDSDKNTYILTESSVLRDSGHIDLSSVLIKFKSTYLNQSILEDANISVDLSDMALNVDGKEKYSNKEVLESIGVSNPDAVIIHQANYGYFFKKD